MSIYVYVGVDGSVCRGALTASASLSVYQFISVSVYQCISLSAVYLVYTPQGNVQDRKCYRKWAENDQKQRRFRRQQDLQHFGSSGKFQQRQKAQQKSRRSVWRRGRRSLTAMRLLFGLFGGVLASETFWSACFVSAFSRLC